MKERFQNPVINDEIKLRLFTYNSNNRASVESINEVKIYFLDPNERTEANPDGRRLVATIDEADVTAEETGQYSVSFTLEDPLYTIGQYIDEWSITFESAENKIGLIENRFDVYPDLWFTNVIPIVYDFSFRVSPNKIRKGSKRWIIIDIIPNVPKASDMERYYLNLAIISPIKISIEQACTACMPKEEDLRLIIDQETVDFREKSAGYYFIDTSDMAVGIYNVWFDLTLGESVYISEKQQIQIY